MTDRFRTLDRDTFDTIVVGAGLGGLTAAALLAQRGTRVLVVDWHYVAGGNATIFRRRGYQFDVGVHFVGTSSRRLLHSVLRAAGAETLEFEDMAADGFDTLLFPDFTFRIPIGIQALRRRLLEHFPREQLCIDRLAAVLEAHLELQRCVGRPREALLRMPRVLPLLRWMRSTYKAFLDNYTKDERLRAVLAGQHLNYALPPSRVSFLMASAVLADMVGGACYPKGGGQIISDHLAEAIERNGGKILLRTSARKILVERGRVTGVEIENKHLGVRVVRAPVVISNADLKRTFTELVGPPYLKRKTLERVGTFEMSPALGVIYLGLRRDLRREGYPRTNYWINEAYDLEHSYASAARGEIPDKPSVAITIASLKDPTNPRLAPAGISNVQLMGIAPSAPEAWGVTESEVRSGSYDKSEAYKERKLAFRASLIKAAAKAFPNIQEEIAYSEVATPLTHQRFTSSTGGTSYGIALTPEQFLWNRPSQRTEIGGLYLCGASYRTGHGVLGVTLSGVFAAAQVSGKQVIEEVFAPLEQQVRALDASDRCSPEVVAADTSIVP